MKKTLLLSIMLLLTAVSLPAQIDFLKAKRTADAPAPALRSTLATETGLKFIKPVAAYYDGALEVHNYYLLLSDKDTAEYDPSTAEVKAYDCNILCLDLYSLETATTTLPDGTYAPGNGESMTYTSDYTYMLYYDASGNQAAGYNLQGNVEVTKTEDDVYTIKAKASDGRELSYTGRLNFIDANNDSYVYPQIRADVETTFTGGLGLYNGNMYQSKTGNMYINLFDGEFDPATGEMLSTGHSLSLCAFARLFPNSSEAVVLPGTYKVARNFAVNTYFPGMEIDYNGTTIVFGSYVKRRKSMTGNGDVDYDFAYITNGTVTITQDDKGLYNFDIDLRTGDGFTFKAKAEGIEIPVIDVSDDTPVAIISNLDHDVDLDLDYIKTARVYKYTVTNGCQSFLLDIGSPSGKDGREGDIIRMEFLVKEGENQVLEGKYNVMEYDHTWTNMYQPGQLVQGYFYNEGDFSGTRYEHFKEGSYNVMDFLAPAVYGSVDVAKVEGTENYHFLIDLLDDAGYYIKGEWTGPLELLYDTSDIRHATSGEKWRVGYLNNNTISVSGAPTNAAVMLYATDGRAVMSQRGAETINISELPQGVYLLKVADGEPVKIMKR